MLSRNKMRHGYYEKQLHIYPGSEHPHTDVVLRGVEVGRSRKGEKERGYFGIGKK